MNTRKMLRPLAVALIICALAHCIASCGSTPQGEAAKPVAGSMKTEGKGYRFESNGWIYLHIEGGPYERGFQHGKLMAREMENMRKALTHDYFINSDLRWPHIVEAADQVLTR